MHFEVQDDEAKMFGPLAKRYEGIELHNPPRPDDVQFTFHTYHGFLVFFIQTQHRVSCSLKDARTLLRRLHWFNLTWGMLSYGLIAVPFLSLLNYLIQKRSISRQEVELQFRKAEMR